MLFWPLLLVSLFTPDSSQPHITKNCLLTHINTHTHTHSAQGLSIKEHMGHEINYFLPSHRESSPSLLHTSHRHRRGPTQIHWFTNVLQRDASHPISVISDAIIISITAHISMLVLLDMSSSRWRQQFCSMWHDSLQRCLPKLFHAVITLHS